ncbi:Arv1 protein [Obelidium mucronatum]|nr:Arv1 protein [Obelidium mucronatum]
MKTSSSSPKCVHCLGPIKALFREYSKGNIRLELCKRCQKFADHYIENDTVVVFVDLVLLKQPVFRHLIHNRLMYDSWGLNTNVLKLALILILFEVYLKWFKLEKHYGRSDFMKTDTLYQQYIHILGLCVLESVIWHSAVRMAVWLFCDETPEESMTTSWYNKLSMSLIISSYGKLFLLLMAIWDYRELDYAWLLNVFVLLSNLEALAAFLNLGSLKTAGLLGLGVFARVCFGAFWLMNGVDALLLI